MLPFQKLLPIFLKVRITKILNRTGSVRIVVLEWQKIMLPVHTADQNLIGAGPENHQRHLRNLWQGCKFKIGEKNMAGKSIYFTRKELEGLRDFINYLNTDGRPDDEELYSYWLGRVGTAEEKIIDACEN